MHTAAPLRRQGRPCAVSSGSSTAFFYTVVSAVQHIVSLCWGKLKAKIKNEVMATFTDESFLYSIQVVLKQLGTLHRNASLTSQW
jgi:hypothetical protein